MKRSRAPESFQPSKRQYFVHPDLKRKRISIHESNKRVRTEECDALHRMLVEAYARIEHLEQELKQSKFLQDYYCSKMSNPSYNHEVECY